MAARPRPVTIVAAFAAVYLLWGATFLAIRFGVETLPPYLLAGLRFLTAGAVLYGWTRWRGAERPTAANWRAAALVGSLLLVGGNGSVSWAQQRVPSGMAAMIIASSPIWMVLLDWLRPRGVRPHVIVFVGLVLGLAGLLLLVRPDPSGTRMDPLGTAALLFASISWAVGSIYSRHARLPRTMLLATGMEMLAGGAILLVASAVTGQLDGFDPRAVSIRSIVSLAYLIVGGSLIGFTAYIWLLRVTSPARAATYAFVNPVVAVLLGWMFAGEAITPQILLGSAVVAAGVALVTAAPRPRAREVPPRPADLDTIRLPCANRPS
jgi:drug/metabolite transporter (DMT)-like permease